jgi:hypothetical protein
MPDGQNIKTLIISLLLKCYFNGIIQMITITVSLTVRKLGCFHSNNLVQVYSYSQHVFLTALSPRIDLAKLFGHKFNDCFES